MELLLLVCAVGGGVLGGCLSHATGGALALAIILGSLGGIAVAFVLAIAFWLLLWGRWPK